MENAPHPLLSWLPLLVVAAAFSGAVQGGWFWDDLRLIVHNPVVQNLDWGSALLRHLWWGVAGETPDGNVYWRPLLLSSFLVDRLLGGSPAVAHFQSLLWHLLAVAGVQRLASLRATPGQSAFAALLFGLHPAVGESVFWVAARNDLMVTAGLLWALWFLATQRTALAMLCVALAALCKETGYLAPLLFFLLVGRGAGMATLVVGGLVALRMALGIPLGGGDLRLEGIGTAGLLLLSQVTVPWPLVGVIWLPASSLGAGNYLGLGLTVLLGFWRRSEGKLLLAGALLAVPALLSVGATGLSGERFLYGSLAFWMVALAGGLQRRWRPAGVLLATVLVGILGFRAVEWTSEESLLRAARERAPSSLLSARLALILEGQGQVEEALQLYAEGLQQVPTFTRVCARPPALLRASGRESEALAWEARWKEVCGD